MKLSTNVVIQALSLVVQGATQLSGFIPVEYKVPVSLGVGILQGIVGLIAHFSNTNGTAQELPGGSAAK